ncbi:putative quinol monooxygenase [Rhizobium leguminosarum]|uniref:putative quinol monooxygenase n=1 Tax=Rhizobium leguminosarum TaxID=384 RepID=UPI000FEC8037|nr:putative quinol monooxygenase [Rhizobium leguminosarum]RWX36657.1 antibiotic biosynthesis monooxygenase [Rhizobium leguminosarum]
MARQLTVIAIMKAKKGAEEELGNRLKALVEPSRSEAGCINYDCHQDQENPGEWVMYENWKDRSDLDHHFTMPYHIKFIADVPDLIEGEIEMHYLDMRSQFAR